MGAANELKTAMVSDEMAKKFATEKETPYTRWVAAEGLEIQSAIYQQNLHAIELRDWPSRGGRGVFLNHDASRTSNDAYVCEIAPGKQLAPQRQLFEEMIYILDGRGSTTVWNDAGVKVSFEWKAGAIFAIPLNASHQHFNADPERPVRLISAVNRIFKACGLNDLEQIEDAPEYRPGVTVTPQMVEDFLHGRVKVTA